MTISNAPRYEAAMNLAGLIGGNFKLIRDRKRQLAVDLVAASVVEGFALADAIKAAKGKLKWTRLETAEQSQMNVLFTAVRLIDGAWKSLPQEVQTAFLNGEKVFSTLAKEIKDAEKAALEAEDKAEEQAQAQAGEAESMTPEGGATIGERPQDLGLAVAMARITEWLATRPDVSELSQADALALDALCGEIDDFRKAIADQLTNAA